MIAKTMLVDPRRWPIMRCTLCTSCLPLCYNYMYAEAGRALVQKSGKESVPPHMTMIFGAIAAVASSSASFPLEIVRRRAMMGTLPAGSGVPHVCVSAAYMLTRLPCKSSMLCICWAPEMQPSVPCSRHAAAGAQQPSVNRSACLEMSERNLQRMLSASCLIGRYAVCAGDHCTEGGHGCAVCGRVADMA